MKRIRTWTLLVRHRQVDDHYWINPVSRGHHGARPCYRASPGGKVGEYIRESGSPRLHQPVAACRVVEGLRSLWPLKRKEFEVELHEYRCGVLMTKE